MDALALIREVYASTPRAMDILVRHGRQVAEKAVAAARRVMHLQPDITFIREAALLHDIGIHQTRAPDLGCTGTHPYLCHGVLGRKILEKRGLPRHALVCERHVGTGITSAEIHDRNLPLPCRDMRPVTLEEEIVCWADKFFSKSETANSAEKSLPDILRQLSAHGPDKAHIFLAWHRRFGSPEAGALKEP